MTFVLFCAIIDFVIETNNYRRRKNMKKVVYIALLSMSFCSIEDSLGVSENDASQEQAQGIKEQIRKDQEQKAEQEYLEKLKQRGHEAQVDYAQLLLTQSMPVKRVVELTGLSEEEVDKLRIDQLYGKMKENHMGSHVEQVAEMELRERRQTAENKAKHKAKVAEAKRLFSFGYTVDEVHEITGLSEAEASKLLDDLRAEYKINPNKPLPSTPADIAETKRLLSLGSTVDEVSRITGVSREIAIELQDELKYGKMQQATTADLDIYHKIRNGEPLTLDEKNKFKLDRANPLGEVELKAHKEL